jgi:predicted phosphodiesterase
MKHANTDFEHRIRTASKLGNPSVLVHCGDFSNDGSDQEIEKFVQWLQWIKGFDYKLVIAGNHDKGLYSKKRKAKCLAFFNRAQKQECEKGKLIYLEDKMIEIEDVKIYGCAYPNPSKSSNDWSFNPYGHIQNCDILLTHIPPYG